MRIAVDLHLHTSLSYCSDKDMTPNNIVNMTLLKGLDVIAITDHNSCDNVEAVIKVANGNLLVIPAMELQTREEIHVLCFFPNLEKLFDFDRLVRKYLIDALIPEIANNQLIMDENDRIIGNRRELLISSVDISLEKAVNEIRNRGGVPVPAHIDRSSFGIFSQIGFIPKENEFNICEVSKTLWKNSEGDKGKITSYLSNRYKTDYSGNLFYSSDAHSLGEILEREMFMKVDSLSIADVLFHLSCKY